MNKARFQSHLAAGNVVMRVALTGRFYVKHGGDFQEVSRRWVEPMIDTGALRRIWFGNDVEPYELGQPSDGGEIKNEN